MKRIISKSIEDGYKRNISAISNFLIKIKLTPLFFTQLGLIFSLIAMGFLIRRSLLSAGIFVLLAGLCDSFDGAIARQTLKVSKYGAFIDSTFDRIGEITIFFGILIYFRFSHTYIAYIFEWVTFLSLAFSLMISYLRARIEGLGGVCQVGILQRPERFILLVVGLILNGIINRMIQNTTNAYYTIDIPLKVVILILFLGGLYTVYERIIYAKNTLDKK